MKKFSATFYFGLLGISILIIQSIITQNIIVVLLSLMGFALILYYQNEQKDVKLVVSKAKIAKHFNRRVSTHYFVMFIEIKNLPMYSQFFDLKLTDSIAQNIYRSLKDTFESPTFLYAVNQLVVVGKFSSDDLSNEALRHDEQLTMMRKLYKHIRQTEFEIHGSMYYGDCVIGSGSIGYSQHIKSFDQLVSLAQFAMMQAKIKHQHYLIADDKMRIVYNDTRLFYQTLEKGLDLDEFEPHFLPIFSKDNLNIVGVESLLRWEQNGYRVIEANKFKDIAYEKNIMREIDLRIIKKTFKQYAYWKREQLVSDAFKIVLNISSRALTSIKKAELLELIHTYDIDLRNIEFDISEQSLHDERVIKAIKNLEEIGFRFSVDTIEAIHNIFDSLLDVDIKTIKLNAKMLPNKYSGKTKQTFYKQFVRIARHFGYEIMSKGVETKQQLEFTRECRVDYVQGYYFTPPLNKTLIYEYLYKYRDGIQDLF
ncbi:MAG: EAL domain-containing protein [Candidatus Izemoplasma sp.]|nr:EAL domain-containing protein [Candidatus Izemoplasma sp.]